MRAAQILRIGRLMNAIFEPKARSQLHAGHFLEAKEQRVRVYFALSNHLIEMRLFVFREDRPRRYRSPKARVVIGC